MITDYIDWLPWIEKSWVPVGTAERDQHMCFVKGVTGGVSGGV